MVARPTGGIVDMASSTFQGIQRYLCVAAIFSVPLLCFQYFAGLRVFFSVRQKVFVVCSSNFYISAFVFCLVSMLLGVVFFLFLGVLCVSIFHEC